MQNVAQQSETDKDRLLWMAVKQGLLLIVGAINRRYNLAEKHERG